MIDEFEDPSSPAEQGGMTEEIIARALQLPADQREIVIRALQASVPSSDDACELDDEWLDELDRRADAADSGTSRSHSVDEAVRMMNEIIAALEK